MEQTIEPGHYELKTPVETSAGMAFGVVVSRTRGTFLMGEIRPGQQHPAAGQTEEGGYPLDHMLKDASGQPIPLPQDWQSMLGERVEDVDY